MKKIPRGEERHGKDGTTCRDVISKRRDEAMEEGAMETERS